MDYYIVFHDGSVLVVGKEIGDKIIATKTTDIVIDGQLYHRNSFSKVLTKDEYYNQYPEKRPESPQGQRIDEKVGMTPEQHEKAMNGLRRGLRDEIAAREARGESVVNAKLILGGMIGGKTNTIVGAKGKYQAI